MKTALHFVVAKCAAAAIAALLLPAVAGAQRDNAIIKDSLENILSNSALHGGVKLLRLYALKNLAETSGGTSYSVYARILLNIGLGEMAEKKDFETAVYFTKRSIKINSASTKGASKFYAARGYLNLGYFYKSINAPVKVIMYADSVIMLAKDSRYLSGLAGEAIDLRVYSFFQTGDYQKCAEECAVAMDYSCQQKDSAAYLYYFNQKVQAECFESHLQSAASQISTIINLAHRMQNDAELAVALTTNALLKRKTGEWQASIALYNQAIQKRLLIGEYHIAATNYNDLGLLYMDSLRNYREAMQCYNKAILLEASNNDSNTLAFININIEEVYFHQHNYAMAANYCIKALGYLKIDCKSILATQSCNQLAKVEAKQLIHIIMGNKTNILLQLFKTSGDNKYLQACAATAVVTDSLFDQTRHLQLGEDSKLFWRDFSKKFYAAALEAAYDAKDDKMAFYFMEKSRAVLLQDKLNELGAAAYLPGNKALEEQDYKIDVTVQQQKLSLLSDGTAEYQKQQLQLQKAEASLQRFVYSLEGGYPLYYQYKYASNIPSLSDIQNSLAITNQSFVYYFAGDSTFFMLGITPKQTKFIKYAAKAFNNNDLIAFQQYCADGQRLNASYAGFAALSNKLYTQLFKPLQLSPGRVIICTDDFVIPFEALSTDTAGEKFLIKNYTFSYVYSASYLLDKLKTRQPEGNFFGIAPVSFAAKSGLPALQGSAEALQQAKQYYSNSTLFVEDGATRSNFFKQAPGYAVVTVFSHAGADTGDVEPVIYMRDSSIKLSELEYFSTPATQLAILSACQTNVGKIAAGEGIYSLARGFAAAGIPSVAATLWKADDEAIYAITQAFNKNLAAGMPKDEALRQAKLAYMQQGGKNQLPYFWANMIVTGNASPLKLAKPQYIWQYATATAAAAIIIIIALVQICHRKKILQRTERAAAKDMAV